MADPSKRAAAGSHGFAAAATLRRPEPAVTRPARNLKDPNVQAVIQFPPVQRYVLDLPAGAKTILIPTEFSIGQTRAMLDDLEQWFGLVVRAMKDLNPLGDGTYPTGEFIDRNGDFVVQAMGGGTTRAKARLILLRIATFADVAEDERQRPTLGELEDGLSSVDLTKISSWLFRKYVEEITARQNRPRKA